MDKTPTKAAPTQKTPEQAFAEAKANFDGALAKTKADQIAQGEEVPEDARVIEPKAEPKPKPAKAEKPKQEAQEDLRAMRAEMAEMKRLLSERAQPEPETEDSDFEAVQAQLMEQFGEDEGKTLGRALKALVEPRERRIEQIEKMLEDGMKRGRSQIARTNRSRLSETYPQLKGEEGDGAWGIVKAQAELAMRDNQDKYDSAEEAYDDIAQLLYGRKSAPELPSVEDVEEASRIAASQPTQPGRTKQERKLNVDQKARAIFDHLRKHPDDLAGAKAISRQATKD
jgi:hypothetical protein